MEEQTNLTLDPTPVQAPAAPDPNTEFCKHCGQQIPRDAVLCTHCGRQVEELAGGQASGGHQ